MRKIILFLTFFLLSNLKLLAQTDEARIHLPTPTGMWQAEVRYMNMDQNLLVFGNYYKPVIKAEANVIPVTLSHTFRVRGKRAKVFAMVARVTSFNVTLKETPIPDAQGKGFADGYVAFEMGIINNDAKNSTDFFETNPEKFNMNGLFRFWYSDKTSYSSDNLINIGSNRMAFEFGLPMQIRINNNTSKMLWLETCPGIQFFTPNNEASRGSFGKMTQKALFYLENHLSYNITSKFYGGITVTYKQGGQAFYERLLVRGANQISILNGGVFLGYKIIPSLEFKASFDSLVFGESRVTYQAVGAGLVFSCFDLKLKQ